MRGTLVRVVNEDWRHLLPRIVAPTLLIWGELDDATPVSDGRLMEQLIPDAGLVVFPGAPYLLGALLFVVSIVLARQGRIRRAIQSSAT